MSLTIPISSQPAPPGSLDFADLTNTTSELLSHLAHFVEELDGTPSVGQTIFPQVAQFVTVIKQGAKAAQCGHTLAADLIELGSEHSSSSTRKDQIVYLKGTLELGDDAFSEARRVYLALSQTRREIFTVRAELKTLSLSTVKLQESYAPERSDQVIKKDMHTVELEYIVEKLGEQVSELTKWWDWIQIETNLHETSAQSSITFDISSLQLETVIDRWRRIRAQFVDYVYMAKELEDRFPELFSMTVKPTTSDREGEESYSLTPQRDSQTVSMSNSLQLPLPRFEETINEGRRTEESLVERDQSKCQIPDIPARQDVISEHSGIPRRAGYPRWIATANSAGGPFRRWDGSVDGSDYKDGGTCCTGCIIS